METAEAIDSVSWKHWKNVEGGIDYENFKQNLRVCMESGAKGFMIGDPIWSGEDTNKILSLHQERNKITEFIKNDIRDRIIEINRIASENNMGHN